MSCPRTCSPFPVTCFAFCASSVLVLACFCTRGVLFHPAFLCHFIPGWLVKQCCWTCCRHVGATQAHRREQLGDVGDARPARRTTHHQAKPKPRANSQCPALASSCLLFPPRACGSLRAEGVWNCACWPAFNLSLLWCGPPRLDSSSAGDAGTDARRRAGTKRARIQQGPADVPEATPVLGPHRTHCEGPRLPTHPTRCTPRP